MKIIKRLQNIKNPDPGKIFPGLIFFEKFFTYKIEEGLRSLKDIIDIYRMEDFMKRLFTTLSAFLCAAFLLTPLTTYAYDYETDEYLDEGGFYVDNALNTNRPNKVVLYLYNEPNMQTQYNRDYYWFYMTKGNIPECDGDFEDFYYYYRPENKKIFDTLSQNDIWVWNFVIEDGTYVFSNGSTNNKYTLTSSYELQDYSTGSYESITVSDGDTVSLYVLNGSEEWVAENEAEFAEWARTNDEANASFDAKMISHSGGNTQESQTITVTEEETEEPEITAEPEETKEQPVIAPVEEPATEEKSGMTAGDFVKGVVCVGILVFLGFFVAKKK
jgi:hypothetical protein